MKKLLITIFAICLAVFMAQPAGAAERYAPGFPNTGEIGTAAKPWGYGYFYNLTVTGTTTDSSTVTATGTYDYSGATSFDIGQAYDIPVSAFWVGDAFAILTASASTSTPYLAMTDGRPAITWASGSAASIKSAEFRIKPWMTGSGLALRAHFVFTGSVCTKSVNWKMTMNTATGTAQSAIAQTAVSIPLTTTSSQYVATLTPNASAIAALLSGSWFGIEITPVASQSGTAGVLYLTGLEYYKP